MCGLSQCFTDTFQKSNVSFGSSNSFMPEEQQVINRENMNHMRNRKLELKRLGFSITDAIFCCYFDDAQLERVKKLTEKDNTLEAKDKAIIIILDIKDSHLNRFKELKKTERLENVQNFDIIAFCRYEFFDIFQCNKILTKNLLCPIGRERPLIACQLPPICHFHLCS